MVTIDVLLLALAFLCFILSAAGVAARVNLQALGLAFWVLTLLI